MTTTQQRRLNIATSAYVVAFVIHNADHARRGIDASPEPVVWAGTFVAMLSVAIVTLVVTKHPVAPMAAAAGGVAIAIGISVSHLLPKWGVLSDPLPGGDVDAFTWFAVLAEIAAAATLAAVAYVAVRRANSKPSVI